MKRQGAGGTRKYEPDCKCILMTSSLNLAYSVYSLLCLKAALDMLIMIIILRLPSIVLFKQLNHFSGLN